MNVKLLISCASCRDWKPQFGISLCGLVQHLYRNGLGGRLKDVGLATEMQSSCLSAGRERALQFAEKHGYTHWLSLDDDMAFPPEIIDKLLSHDLPVVTANYRRKESVVRGVCLTVDGKFMDSTGKTGLEEVGWMGGGMMLIQIDKVKHIPEPRFSVLWVKEKKDYMDQDNYFAMKLRENGVKIFCDHEVSNMVKHIGDFGWSFDEKIKSVNFNLEAAE